MIKPLEWNDYETSIICSHTATTFCLAYAVTRYKMANGEWASYAVTVGGCRQEMIGRCPDLDGAKGMAEQHWKNLLSPYVCTTPLAETTGISAESVDRLKFAARVLDLEGYTIVAGYVRDALKEMGHA